MAWEQASDWGEAGDAGGSRLPLGEVLPGSDVGKDGSTWKLFEREKEGRASSEYLKYNKSI